jgi:hypothetical protein
MKQIARNLMDTEDGFLIGARYLIHDRDPLFADAFRELLKLADLKTLKLPARRPDLQAYAERFVLEIRSECWASFACHPAAPRRSLVLCASRWASVIFGKPCGNTPSTTTWSAITKVGATS